MRLAAHGSMRFNAFSVLLVLALAEARVCPSVEVRNNMSQFDRYAGCTIIEGYVQIALLSKTTEADFLNFTKLAEVREITQYLLVYRVQGLVSLGQLFPKLALIRGTELVANTASLAIYENFRLQEVGLYALTDILAGSVVIHKNFDLCYANSIDWKTIMRSDSSTPTFYEVIGQNKDEQECTSKSNCAEEHCERNACWNRKNCQILRLEGCHPLCAGGCYQHNSSQHCYACKGYLNGDECVSTCPEGSFLYLQRTCVSEEQCRKTPSSSKDSPNHIPFNHTCVPDCPSFYTRVGDSCLSCDSAKVKCRKVCTPHGSGDDTNDTFRVQTVSGAKHLQSCTHVNGSVEISIRGKHSPVLEAALLSNLGMIEEISGQLKIMHSEAIETLNFLQNLWIIGGQVDSQSELQYTLIVKDNKNLHQLWDWDKRRPQREFRIRKGGKVLFHYNGKLCLSEINKLFEIAKLPPYDDNWEVSRESNGHQTICNSTIQLNVTVDVRSSNSVILGLHLSGNNSNDGARFMVLYRESKDVLNKSVQYESLTECGDNQWKMTDYVAGNNGTIPILLTGLEPATEYAFFVKSLSSTESMMGVTEIYNMTTLPSRPSPPLDFKVNYATDSEVSLSWKMPWHPHGVLTNYQLMAFWQNDLTSDIEQRDYCVYKLQKNEVLVSKPASSTTPAPVQDQACNCDPKPQTPKFDCNSYEHWTDINLNMVDVVGMESCDAFIYGTMYAHSRLLEDYGDTMPTHNFPTMEPLNDNFPLPNVTGPDGRFDRYFVSLNANVTTFSIPNLRHFSQYIVLMTACREKKLFDIQDRAERCSRSMMLSVRTESSPLADHIDPNHVIIQVNNQTVIISWTEPAKSNSFVHSYVLEYRSTEVENFKYIDYCITAKNFKMRNNSFSIENLESGHYELRLKAISLAGDGPYLLKSFYIAEHNRNELLVISCLAMVVIVILLVLSAFMYYWKQQMIKNRVLFASVNPRYEPVYVEDHWEIPRENLTLIKQLGRGVFGSVHEGLLQPDNIKCAVKTLISACEEDNMIFLKEATIMKEFHKAFHIVRLIGVVSKESPVYVIMELMELGDLKSFLLRYGSDMCDETGALPGNIVIRMAAEIADGMAFLEAKKFVHRDLAARNCMVAADRTIKIGDFGLARDIYETDYYRKGDKGTLPIRWMAPESIRDGIFTSTSDVWSYGVVLWEITTLALMPYHPKSNEQVIKHVQSGHILDIPANTCEVLKPLMRSCWSWHASHRPKFPQILKILDTYMDHTFRKVSYYHNGESPNDPENVVPCHADDCYIYSDKNNEISLRLGQSPDNPGPSVAVYRNIGSSSNSDGVR